MIVLLKTRQKAAILTLNPDEVQMINEQLENLVKKYQKADDENFIKNASIHAHLLPERVKNFLNEFRLSENYGACIVRGYPINNEEIGSTPSHWNYTEKDKNTVKQDILFILYGSMLGDVFGWSTEQNGKLVQDILPIKGDENKQVNSASEELITWHTEDSFQTYAPDYLGLFCLRNFEKAATTFASANSIELEERYKKILFEKRFIIKPDNAHKIDHSLPFEKTSILFGSFDSPYLRVDPYFMDRTSETEDEKAALNQLIHEFDEVIDDVILQSGDALFVDNFRAIHGRKPFRAKYDGQDRWLKRIRITRDLRKSRSHRISGNDRIIKN